MHPSGISEVSDCFPLLKFSVESLIKIRLARPRVKAEQVALSFHSRERSKHRQSETGGQLALEAIHANFKDPWLTRALLRSELNNGLSAKFYDRCSSLVSVVVVEE